MANFDPTKYGAIRVDEQQQQNVQTTIPNFNDTPSQPQQKNNGFLGKTMNFLSEMSGAKSAVELVAPLAEAFSYAGSFLQGKLGKQYRQNLLLGKPVGELMQQAETGGMGGVIKNVAGKTLEVATSAAPFARGAGLAIRVAEEVSKLNKFPTISRYLNYAKTGAGYGAAFGLAQGLQEDKDVKSLFNETIRGTILGALTGVALPAVVEGTVRGVKNLMALYSGVPRQSLEIAFNKPEIVGQKVREYARDQKTTEEILLNAEDSFQTIKNIRNNQYEQSLKRLGEEIFVTKTGKNAGRVYVKDSTGSFVPTDLTLDGVKQTLYDSLKKFKVDLSGTNKSSRILPSAEMKDLKDMTNMINEWDDITPEGLNLLKQNINGFYSKTGSGEFNSIVLGVKKDLINYITKKFPLIGDMNKTYAEASDYIDKLQREIFGKTGNVSETTKLKRLLNIFDPKSPMRADLVSELGEKAGTDLVNEIVASSMASWLPSGWVQRFILSAGGGIGIGASFATGSIAPLVATAAVGLPRVAGKIARTAGQISRVAIPAGKKSLPYIIKQENR